MPAERIVVLTAEFESIQSRLIAIADEADRAALLEEMRAVLQDLEVVIQLAQTELLS